MRKKLAVATVLGAVLTLLTGGAPGSVAAGSSTLRPWGKGLAGVEAAAGKAAAPAVPAGATRLVVIAREVDFAIIDVGPPGDSPGDSIVFTDDLVDQAGHRVGRDEARCTIMFRADVLCDATFVLAGRGQLTIHGVGLTFAVTGGTGEFKKARGQLHETFLPTGEFRFAFTLFR